MTVIAYDGRTVAADRLAVSDSFRQTMTKLFRHEGKVLAVSGRADYGMALVAWYMAGAKPQDFPKFTEKDEAFLTVFERGKHPIEYQGFAVPLVMESAQYAAGCGRGPAMAAMLMGADARRAVEVASLVDVGCGGGIDVMELYDEPGLGGPVAAPSRADGC